MSVDRLPNVRIRAFRRSEVVAFNAVDARFVDDGLTLDLRRSKTDQEGAGRLVGLAYGSRLETCPVRALKAWIELAGAAEDGRCSSGSDRAAR